MTLRIHRLKEAEEDLIDIWCYIAADNPMAATKLLHEIDQKCTLIAEFPGMGMLREDIGVGVRHFPVGSYLILYRVTATHLDVVRVIHGARTRFDI